MSGFVYAIGDGCGRVKIGYSGDPLRRLTKIASDCPESPELIGVIPATRAQEAEIHGLLAPWRVRREWYVLVGPVLAFVAALPKPAPRAVKPHSDHPLVVWRKANGHSIYSLGELLGVSPVAVSRWERGTRFPRPGQLRTLSALTGLSSDVFCARAA